MLSDEHLAAIREGLAQAPDRVRLVFHPAGREGDVAFGELLAEVAARVEGAADGVVVVERGSGEGVPALPCLSIRATDARTVHYLALPEGHQIGPFVETLIALGAEPAAEPWLSDLAALSDPAELTVFIAAFCPHCPQAVRAANRLATACPRVTVSIVDAQRFPELAERFSAQSVPLTAIDAELKITGVVPPDQLVSRLASRGTSEHGQQILRAHIESGRVAEAVAHVRSGVVEHFLQAWRTSTTADRIGLMMVAETALEEDPRALYELAQPLVPVLGVEDAALRGDTADLLGQIGNPMVISALRPLLDDPNPDVAEIAADAMEELAEEERGEA